MSTDQTHRFQFADLVALVEQCSARELAELLDISPRTVHRYRKAGLNAIQADRIAVSAGFHPAEVWPDWW